MNALLAYLLYVGVPLAGLLAVLRLGEAQLGAPEAVHGAYAVTTAGPRPACLDAILSEGDSAMAISQSGSHLVVTLGTSRRIVLEGRLAGKAITAQGLIERDANGATGCTIGDTVRLTGAVLRLPGAKRFDGKLTVAPCRGCAPVDLVAQRPRGYPHTRRS